jgi:uncharacterized membrane protein
MDRRLLATSTLAVAVALSLGAQTLSARADDASDKMEKCYGVNARGQNDCAAGAHSCAGQSTKDRDAEAYILLPAGVCGKIADSTTKAG